MRLKRYPNREWWSAERVVAGLRRFYLEQGHAPTATSAYNMLTRHTGKAHERRYPSFYAVLRFFRTFRQAWQAANVDVNRNHEEWLPEEDWYLVEAAGILPRKEIARDLRRTPLAVKTRLIDRGLHSYTLHGWSMNRIVRATGVARHWLERYVARGKLPARKGSKCWIIDPADLLVVKEIDWECVPPELDWPVRRALVERLVGVLRVCVPATNHIGDETGRKYGRRRNEDTVGGEGDGVASER